MSLEGCSQFTINDGNFNAITGSQHIYNGTVVQSMNSKERTRTILDEYQEIPIGKVHLKRGIAGTCPAVTSVQTHERVWESRGLEACQTICVAGVRGEDKDEEFLHVQYSGRDAVEACKLDFDIFSAVKDINYVQLFGYSNMNAKLPALVFYEALVPVSYIWERNNFSPLLLIYFSWQIFMVQGLDHGYCEELWADPKTGFLRVGPIVPHSNKFDGELTPLATTSRYQPSPSLTLQTYSDTSILFEYLNGKLRIGSLIHCIQSSARRTFTDYPSDEDLKSDLPYLLGTIYNQTSGEIITRYPEYREKWCHNWPRLGVRVSTSCMVPESLQGSVFTMENGSRRLTLKRLDARVLRSFALNYDLWPGNSQSDFSKSWLSQVHGIFSQLGIEKDESDESDEYCMLSSFWLHLERVEEYEASHTCMDVPDETPIYLFLRPIPSSCYSEEQWDSWLGEAKYYWSLDPSGADAVTEHERLNLGLPTFTTNIQTLHDWWDWNTFDAFERVHRSRGFDPTSTELATSLGYTILEVMDRNSRFDEVDDDATDCYVDGYHTTTHEYVCKDSDTVEGDTDDDEVVLYPRLKNLCL